MWIIEIDPLHMGRWSYYLTKQWKLTAALALWRARRAHPAMAFQMRRIVG